MLVGILAVEGKVLPLPILREGLAKVTMCAEGYTYDDETLDAMTLIVVACACGTGHVVCDGDNLCWNSGISAGKDAGILN